ncbi:MAG TPA: HAD family hydrolase [Candidatus Binataceae bacterium]|jgi:phosphoglycolate phosphatase
MSREFRAIFFDLDGTLVDIHGPLYIAAKNALEQLGHQPPLTRERFDSLIARNDMWLGIPESMRRDYAKLAFAYFMTENDNAERLEVLPHVVETLAALKRRGYATGVITSRPGEPRKLIEKLAMVGLASHLDHIVTQQTKSLRALDKSDALRQTAMRAGVLPHACMYVGDEPRDMLASANAGYGARVAVATGAASYDHLRDYSEPPADFILGSMGELLDLIDRLRASDRA